MAVRSGDGPSYRRPRQSSLTIPQHTHQSSPTSGSKRHVRNPKSIIGVFFSRKLRLVRQNLDRHVFNSEVRVWFLGLFVIGGLLLSFGLFASSRKQSSSKRLPLVFPPAGHPRLVALEESSPLHIHKPFPATVEQWRSTKELAYGSALSESRSYDSDHVTPENEVTRCNFIADWQKQTSPKPNCNIMHEVGIQMGNPGLMNRLEFIDSGRLKQVWRVFGEDNEPANFVLKTSVYGRKFNSKELDNHLRDAFVMEASTSNKFVLDNFSYCAYSSIAESAVGTLKTWLATHRKQLSSLQLLQIAVQIANGVEGMHLYHNGMPTFAHADIKPPQFLLIQNGNDLVFKVNDFNRGRYLTSKNPPNICPFYMGSNHKGSTMRAPEEYEKGAPQNDKIDVFSMGSVFYHLLTGVDPFKDIKFSHAMENIRTGVLPPISTKIQNSTDPSIAAIVTAMDQCRRFKQEDRPTSKQVAEQLRAALSNIMGSQTSNTV